MAFSDHLAQTSPTPMGLEISHAEGVYIWDTNGKRYLDLISGLAVANIGHRHPAVLEAVAAQMDRYTHVIPYGEFAQQPQNDLAEALSSILPTSLDCAYFVNSGTEAIEASMKLAKRVTGRHEMVAMKGGYHGATHGALSITGNEVKKQAFRPMIPGNTFIRFNETADLGAITEKTAAVIVEPVQGDAGVRIPSVAYMQALRERCTAVGALLIADEVQTGFGRTGRWFGFEHFGIVPDIVAIAKAFGGGLPIGAFVSSRANMHQLTHDPVLGHITTFGGHPVCCAAALANIGVLQTENWIAEAESKGALFKSSLKSKRIIDVRQIGLMMAVELDSAARVAAVVDHLKARGIIGFYFLSCRNAFRIAPPLCISEEQIRWACEVITSTIDSVD